MTTPMDKKSEDKLVAAVKLVSASVENGDTPNDAVVKVAGQLKIGRSMLPLVIQAYNVGRTTFQREHGGNSIIDKQASFPIAHLETIVGQLYPAEPKTAGQLKQANHIDPAYSRPPSGPPRDEVQHMEKVAEASVRMPEDQRAVFDRETAAYGATESVGRKIKVAFAERSRALRGVDEAGYEYRVAKDKYLAAMGAIGEYFKEAQPWRLPFDEVEWNAAQRYGEPAKHAMAYAYQRNGMKEKRASGPPSLLRAVDWDAAPYTLIKIAIDRGRDMLDAFRATKTEQKSAEQQVEAAFRPFVPAPSTSDPLTVPCSILGASPEVSSLKEAGFLTNMMSMGAGAKMKGMGDAKGPGDMVDDASLDLSSPDHMSEMRDIETRAMLSDFLNNDEVIAGYDPEEVMGAFNEISRLSPRTSNQPAVIRPLLRKRLTQGAMEPFEAQSLADLEKTVGQSQSLDSQVQPGAKMSEVISGNRILR